MLRHKTTIFSLITFFAKSLVLLFLACLAQSNVCWAAKTLNVAAAGVLIYPLQEIAQLFQDQTGLRVRLHFNSSESLAKAIEKERKYDLFFSANHKRPRDLARKGICYPPVTYGYGVLILWSKNPKIRVLGWPGALWVAERLALPNPKMGPYGAVAKLILVKEKLWEKVQDKVVIVPTVCEAFLKAKNGQIEAAFASLSLVLGDPKLKGGYIVVPHAPLIEQKACVVKGPNEKQARKFLNFVLSPQGQKSLRKYGYF